MTNMILYDKTIKEIESMFLMPTLYKMWPDIQTRYMQMGFKDNLSDSEMIAEYTYILEQYRKYISSHQKEILSNRDDLEKMLEVVEVLIEKAPEKDMERKILVYNTLRDDWLIDLYNVIVMGIADREEDEDAE